MHLSDSLFCNLCVFEMNTFIRRECRQVKNMKKRNKQTNKYHFIIVIVCIRPGILPVKRTVPAFPKLLMTWCNLE